MHNCVNAPQRPAYTQGWQERRCWEELFKGKAEVVVSKPEEIVVVE